MWGTGDAAAALIGIPFGNHKIKRPKIETKKSWEGTLSMMIVSTVFGAGVLLYSKYNVINALLCAVLGGLFGAVVEMLSPSEWDTVTVPTVVLIVLLTLSEVLV